MVVLERSGSGATPFRTFDLGWRLGTMVVRSGAVAERHLPNFRLRAAVGDDGGTKRSDSGATPFRTFDLGWLVGIDGGRPERSFSGATPF